MIYLRAYVRFVNAINEWIGRGFRYLILPLIAILLWEVLRRYVFNAPTVWSHELSAMIFAVYFLMGGAYAQRRNAHINVEILYIRLPPRGRAATDLLTWTLFYLFCGVLFYKSIDYAWASVVRLERSNSVWEPYIWPVKIFLPIASGLLLLQGSAKTISDLVLLVTGSPLGVDERTNVGEVRQ